MKRRAKQHEIAALMAKSVPNLPSGLGSLEGAGAALVAEPISVADLMREALAPCQVTGEDRNACEGEAELGSLETATTALTAIEKPEEILARRLLEEIEREVGIMRRVQPDSLAVALQPDRRTEVFLRLRERNGQIEAFARLERGDLSRLKSLWPELQRCLESQGVQLLALCTSLNLATAEPDGPRRNFRGRTLASMVNGLEFELAPV